MFNTPHSVVGFWFLHMGFWCLEWFNLTALHCIRLFTFWMICRKNMHLTKSLITVVKYCLWLNRYKHSIACLSDVSTLSLSLIIASHFYRHQLYRQSASCKHSWSYFSLDSRHSPAHESSTGMRKRLNRACVSMQWMWFHEVSSTRPSFKHRGIPANAAPFLIMQPFTACSGALGTPHGQYCLMAYFRL